MPLQDRLKHHTTQLQKWLDTVRAAKKTHHLISTTLKITKAYNFGRSKLQHTYMNLFTTPLRTQLRATLQEQIQWPHTYNSAVIASAKTLHHYFQPSGRPPGGTHIGDLIP